MLKIDINISIYMFFEFLFNKIINYIYRDTIKCLIKIIN